MAALLSLAFFLSGAAALLFEALWLRRAGLMLGSSVWASSIVLAAFMTGLAAGNALAVRWAARIRRPLRAYALLELGVGAAGAAAVLAAPALAPLLAPLFRGLGGATALIESAAPRRRLRAGAAAHHGDGHHPPRPHPRRLARRPRLRPVLGGLYGWNTLGGVLGAVAGELWLIAPLGLRGTAFFAAGLNLLAAALAWWLSRRRAPAVDTSWRIDRRRPRGRSRASVQRARRLLARPFSPAPACSPWR
jgi:hypothetical protein